MNPNRKRQWEREKVDRELLKWKAGNTILLQLVPEGCEHKAPPAGGKPAHWPAILYMPQWDQCGGEMTQVELSYQFQSALGGA